MKLGKFIGIVLIALLLVTSSLNAGEFKLGSGGSVKVGSGGNIILSTPSWVPTDVPGCVLWLRSDFAWQDAAKTVPCTNLSLLWTGEDKSGSLNDAVQATETKRPIYLTNQINGHPAWRFDAIDDLLGYTQIVLDSGFSAFYVIKTTRDSWLGVNNEGGTRQIRYNQVDNKLSIYDGVNNPFSDLLTTVKGNWVIVEYIDTDTTVSFYENGTSRGSGNCVAMTFGQVGSGILPIGGDLAEVIIYDSSLSDTNRQRVELYLNTEAQGNGYAIY